MLRVLDILHGTVVDGAGLRSSIYFAGCKHHCPECHNPESWNFAGGVEKSVDEIFAEIEKNKFNVTLSGGDPLFQNIADLTSLVKKIKSLGLNIWLYTGFTIEKLLELKIYDELLQNIDVVVDGPFEIKNKNTLLFYRGSSNQRILKISYDAHKGGKIFYDIMSFEN
ncbi:MAG: anaerobic ribonucleoside-triphosphate reductase activating protein [Cytophagales bacterium]|jgi:anaerobic ribonucleoside-triphosphate reductase activating protein|nr:anaerobic ribonucleoside-triphosphate reductase activating protein [Cytophagales bacterium]